MREIGNGRRRGLDSGHGSGVERVDAAQRDLIGALGAVGAAQVRFLFGLPFAVMFLVGLLVATGLSVPGLTAVSLAWTLFGAVSQVIATSLMLAAMRTKSFVVGSDVQRPLRMAHWASQSWEKSSLAYARQLAITPCGSSALSAHPGLAGDRTCCGSARPRRPVGPPRAGWLVNRRHCRCSHISRSRPDSGSGHRSRVSAEREHRIRTRRIGRKPAPLGPERRHADQRTCDAGQDNG
jgi:hypothetical protein